MNQHDTTLNLKFIESYLRKREDNDTYDNLKQQLYNNGYSQTQVIELLVEGQLYGDINTFYQKHPDLH